MKTHFGLLAAVALGAAVSVVAQDGPFDTEEWPPTIDPNKLVDYVVTDGGLDSPNVDYWYPDGLIILTGGDQVTEDVTIGGHTGKKVVGNFLNVADTFFEIWADTADPVIDILVQVYGNEALLNAQGEPRDYTFLTGVLPELNFPVGGQIPAEANNKKWNWVLFRIPNETRTDGTRFVGSIPDGAQGGFTYGGVNGGTIRFEAVPGLIVRCVAFGEQGAFGEPEQINQFFPPDECDPEPDTNLVGLDVNAQTSDQLVVVDSGDQTVTYSEAVGPAGDLRRAVAASNPSNFLNFGITEEYLGKPCNDPHAVKVCVEFYDDPAFAGAGVQFGPEAFATDALGGVATYPAGSRHLLQGSGEWIRRSWIIGSVNLNGVNTEPYTGGPRFISANAPVYVSSIQMAVLRTGDHPLAGLDPLEDCFEDPNICTGEYGDYAELDLATDTRMGLDVGTSGGDQEMIVEEAGPVDDRRMAVRPAFDDGSAAFVHRYLNFAITEEALGPSSQPPAHLAICVTYYDDPALVGASFRPEVYQTEVNGALTLGFTPGDAAVTLQGTDEWRTAYWEIERIKFNGVNQGPQAAARFWFSDGGKVFFTSVKYAVIRPCGPSAGINLLEDCKPVEIVLEVEFDAASGIRLAWPTSASAAALQETPDLTTPEWAPVTQAPEEIDGSYVVQVPVTDQSRFYRLIQ